MLNDRTVKPHAETGRAIRGLLRAGSVVGLVGLAASPSFAGTCQPGTTLKLLASGATAPLSTVYQPGDSPQFKVTGVKPGAATITDFFGNTTTVTPIVSANYSGWALTLPAQSATGYYELTVAPAAGGPAACLPFAVIRTIGVDRRFGVNTQIGLGDPPGLERLVKAANIGAVRDVLPWSNVVASSTAALAVPANADTYMTALQADGIAPLLTLAFGNTAFEPAGSSVYTLPYGATAGGTSDLAAFGSYASGLAQRYKKFGTTLSLAVWNEVNGSFCQGPACATGAARLNGYDALTRQTAQSVLATGLHPRLVGGASAGFPIGWYEQLFASSAGGCASLVGTPLSAHHLLDTIDAVDVHSYARPEEMDANLRDLATLTAACGGTAKPFAVTEFGGNDWRDAANNYAIARQQAPAELVRAAATLLTRGATMYWYSLHDRTITPAGNPQNLLYSVDNAQSFLPRPAYVAYANLIGQMNGLTPLVDASGAPLGNMAPDARSRLYGFGNKTGAQTLYVAWTTPEMVDADIRGLDQGSLGFTAPGNVTVTDVMGRTLGTWRSGASVSLAISSTPVFIRIASAQAPAFSTAAPPLVGSSFDDFGPAYRATTPVGTSTRMAAANPVGGSWSYGGIVAPNGDAQSVSAGFQSSFRPATQWTTGTWGMTGMLAFLLNASGQEASAIVLPNGTRQSLWATRRWTCPATGPSCAVAIGGSAHLASTTAVAGTRLFIIANDQVAYEGDMIPNGSGTYPTVSVEAPGGTGQPVQVTVAPGQPIDFAVTTGPLVNGAINDANGYTALSVWVAAQSNSPLASARAVKHGAT